MGRLTTDHRRRTTAFHWTDASFPIAIGISMKNTVQTECFTSALRHPDSHRDQGSNFPTYQLPTTNYQPPTTNHQLPTKTAGTMAPAVCI